MLSQFQGDDESGKLVDLGLLQGETGCPPAGDKLQSGSHYRYYIPPKPTRQYRLEHHRQTNIRQQSITRAYDYVGKITKRK